MYTHQFTLVEDELRLRLDMTRTEGIIERHNSTIIVTSSDTYHVKETFDEVDQAWQDAANFEASKSSNISA